MLYEFPGDVQDGPIGNHVGSFLADQIRRKNLSGAPRPVSAPSVLNALPVSSRTEPGWLLRSPHSTCGRTASLVYSHCTRV